MEELLNRGIESYGCGSGWLWIYITMARICFMSSWERNIWWSVAWCGI